MPFPAARKREAPRKRREMRSLRSPRIRGPPSGESRDPALLQQAARISGLTPPRVYESAGNGLFWGRQS